MQEQVDLLVTMAVSTVSNKIRNRTRLLLQPDEFLLRAASLRSYVFWLDPPDISITRDVSTNSWAALVCRSGDVWVTVERILATARIRIGSPGRDRIYKANLARRS